MKNEIIINGFFFLWKDPPKSANADFVKSHILC